MWAGSTNYISPSEKNKIKKTLKKQPKTSVAIERMMMKNSSQLKGNERG